MNNQYPLTFSLFFALLYLGSVAILFTKRCKEDVQAALWTYPGVAWWVTVLLCAGFEIYTSHTGGVHLPTLLATLAYFVLPCLLIWFGRGEEDKIRLVDWLAIAALWLPFDLHWVKKRPNAIHDALDWPLTAVSAVIIGLVFWVCLRQIKDTKTCWNWTRKEFGIAALAFTCLAALLIPLGMQIGFVVPRDFVKNSDNLFLTILSEIFSKKFAWYFTKIFLTIALSEEFLFRGILQNFLDQTFKRQWKSLALASLLFGAAHLNNGATSVYLYDWNWTYAGFASVAGLAYGLTFRYTNSLIYSMLVHAMVDACWHTFFK